MCFVPVCGLFGVFGFFFKQGKEFFQLEKREHTNREKKSQPWFSMTADLTFKLL